MYRNEDRNVLLFCIGCVHVVELRNGVERDTTTARSKCSAPIRLIVTDH